MKQLTILILFCIINLFTLSMCAQVELFKNESKLASCLQDIPLTYNKSSDLKVEAKAKELHDKELVLLQYDKKTGTCSYKRYYLKTERIKSTIYNILVPSKDYLAKNNVAIFLKFTAKYDRFYLAECFDKVLASDKELKELLKEKE